MSSPLLSTKLYVPTPRKGIISRTKLIEQLNSGSERKLTLVSAPAGYGKTTLLADWIEQHSTPVCWISLDAQDNNLKRFFSYLIASFRSINIPILENTLADLSEQRSGTITDFIGHLVNQLSNHPQPISLVLDDYHHITNPDNHQALSYLLENLPPDMHLIIATRSDPPLRLAKLRAQGELCEIRVDDLRFTIDETARYFNDKVGLGLTLSDIATLMQKTEGWIAGIQLAGVSLKNNPDKHQFVLSFAGDNRYIADYLFDEALNRQPEHIQAFLLKSSILERLNAPLCNAVMHQENSHAILAELDRANLFLIPLDDQRNWYRYHHLFGELLQNRLKQTTPEIIPELHARASIWFEEHNLLADSISHALAADEIQRVVHLTENMAVHKMDTGELADLMVWLERQPETILHQYPWLLVAHMWANINIGKLDQTEMEISDLQVTLSSQPYPEELVKRIQGHLAAIRSYLADMRATDADAAIKAAEEALSLLDDRDIQLRSFVAIRLANGFSWKGDLQKAIQALKEAGNASKLAGDCELAINALSEMTSLQMAIGRLHQADQTALEIKDYAEMLAQKYGRPLPAMGILYRQLGNIKYELDELDHALVYARQAVQLCQQGGGREALCLAYHVLGKVYFGYREFEQSDHYFDRGTELAKQLFTEGTNIALHTRNNYLLLQGRLEETEKSVREQGLTTQDRFGFQRRLEYQNFARLLAARGEFDKALDVIDRVIKVIESADAKRLWIRAKIVQAKIYRGLNRPDEALAAIESALGPASRGGFIRGFLDEGEDVAQLLYQAARKGAHPEYCQMLLDRFDLQIEKAPAHHDLVEPLSERELEVLRHIARGCSNQEIAAELIISLSTVKSHARNIYGKLGVKNRTEAVARARLYGLLTED